MNSRRENEATCPVDVSSAASAQGETLRRKREPWTWISLCIARKSNLVYDLNVLPYLAEIRQF
jgi:hypothetical protein